MKATGASPEEIAKTVLTAMASSGADPEEIAKTMQALLEDSGKKQLLLKSVWSNVLDTGSASEKYQ